MELSNLMPMDRGAVLWLNTHEFLPAKPVAGAECRALEAADIERLSRIKDFDIDEQLVKDFTNLNFVSVGIFVDKNSPGCPYFVPMMYLPDTTDEAINSVVLHCNYHRGLAA